MSVKNRPLPGNLDSRSILRLGGHATIGGSGRELVQYLLGPTERKPTQDDEVALSEWLPVVQRCGWIKSRILGPLEQTVERTKRARTTRRWLAVDLLQAQHVSPQSKELRPQDCDALRQRGRLVRSVIKILEIKRCNAKNRRHPFDSIRARATSPWPSTGDDRQRRSVRSELIAPGHESLGTHEGGFAAPSGPATGGGGGAGEGGFASSQVQGLNDAAPFSARVTVDAS